MASRVVLHIGAMKSATTYLQGIFDANADTLAAAGFLWPGSRANFDAVKDLMNGGSDGHWRRLRQGVDGHDGPALVSNELISVRGPAATAKIVRRLRTPVEVIVTARDLGRVIASQWQTGQENGRRTPWAEFIAALVSDDQEHPDVPWFWRRQDLVRIIDQWTPHATSITLITVPPAGSPLDLTAQRFAQALGQDASVFRKPSIKIPRQRNHPRLSADELVWADGRAAAMVEALADRPIRVIGALSELQRSPSEASS